MTWSLGRCRVNSLFLIQVQWWLALLGGEVDVHAGAPEDAGGIDEQWVVYSLHVAVHPCDRWFQLDICLYRLAFFSLCFTLHVVVMGLLLSAVMGIGGAEIHVSSEIVPCDGDGPHLVLLLLLCSCGRRVLGGAVVIATVVVLGWFPCAIAGSSCAVGLDTVV